MSSFKKYPHPPHGRSLGILGESGVSKAKMFKGNGTQLNWNFKRGEGFKEKNFPQEGYGYFLEQQSVNARTIYNNN